MNLRFSILLFTTLGLTLCNTSLKNTANNYSSKESILKIEMSLSAFGVESDGYPSIDAHIDFQNDSGNCIKSYYDPTYKNSTYSLNRKEIQEIKTLLFNTDLQKLKKEFTVLSTDQPTSTLTIYTNIKKITVKDYGLKGDYPLQELYKIVYKL